MQERMHQGLQRLQARVQAKQGSMPKAMRQAKARMQEAMRK